MSSKPEGATFNFTVKIPNLQDPKPSSGEIKNLTAAQNLTVAVPKRSGGKNGEKSVTILPPSVEVDKITFLFIRPDWYSDDCRKLICKPGPVSSSGTSSTDAATYSDVSTQKPMDHQKPHDSTSSDTHSSTNPFLPKSGDSSSGSETGDLTKIAKPPREGTCYYIPLNQSDPTQGGHWYYPNDTKDLSKGGSWYYQSGGQGYPSPTPVGYPSPTPVGYPSPTPVGYPSPTPVGYPSPTPVGYPSPTSSQVPGTGTGTSTKPVALNLENDVFLIGSSVISLLGSVATLTFENPFDRVVTVQIILGYDVES
jgi:hypothetical protein